MTIPRGRDESSETRTILPISIYSTREKRTNKIIISSLSCINKLINIRHKERERERERERKKTNQSIQSIERNKSSRDR
jgi:hypothetical protein